MAAAGPDWIFCDLGAGAVGYGTRLSLAPLRGFDLTLEHPIRLWRPNRADPVRRSAIPEQEVGKSDRRIPARSSGPDPPLTPARPRLRCWRFGRPDKLDVGESAHTQPVRPKASVIHSKAGNPPRSRWAGTS